MKNVIELELTKVGGDFNLRIQGTDHVGVETWDVPGHPHHAAVCFYTVDVKQVLEAMVKVIGEQVARL